MKRTFVSLVLVVVFALSATAFAALPVQQATPAPADGTALAALTDFGAPFMPANDECPGAGDTGCGG